MPFAESPPSPPARRATRASLVPSRSTAASWASSGDSRATTPTRRTSGVQAVAPNGCARPGAAGAARPDPSLPPPHRPTCRARPRSRPTSTPQRRHRRLRRSAASPAVTPARSRRGCGATSTATASRRSSSGSGPRRSAAAKEGADEARDPQVLPRLHRDPRSVRARARASAPTSSPSSGSAFPLVQDKPQVIQVELAGRPGRAARPGPDRACGRREDRQIGERRARGRQGAGRRWSSTRSTRACIRDDATALLRPKTGAQGHVPRGRPGQGASRCPRTTVSRSANTAPDIDPDEIFSALDADTRDYLKLLISGRARASNGRGEDLRKTFQRLEPLHRDLGRLTTAVARRRDKPHAGWSTTTAQLTSELGSKDEELDRLVGRVERRCWAPSPTRTPTSPPRSASCPARCARPRPPWARSRPSADRLGPALERPAPALPASSTRPTRAVRPSCARPRRSVRDQIRPFARAARPYVADLGGAASRASVQGRAGPDHAPSTSSTASSTSAPTTRRRRRGADREPRPRPRRATRATSTGVAWLVAEHRLAVLDLQRPGPVRRIYSRRRQLQHGRQLNAGAPEPVAHGGAELADTGPPALACRAGFADCKAHRSWDCRLA